MLRVLDRAVAAFPDIALSVYVDDMDQHAVGPAHVVASRLPEAVLSLGEDLEVELELEISSAKSLCLASSPSLGAILQRKLGCYGMQWARCTKQLGVDMVSGRVRSTKVQRQRLASLRKRLHRYRRLRAAGVSTTRLMMTGGVPAIKYGFAVTGVSNSALLQQRRVVASAAGAPGKGKNLDLQLIFAVGDACVDPAFAAHHEPIHAWALAVWEKSVPVRLLDSMLSAARRGLDRSAKQWAVVRGPAAAFLATLRRLRWDAASAHELTTDEGVNVDLHVTSPAAVGHLVAGAVHRWRWQRLHRVEPSLDIDAIGPFVEPLQALFGGALTLGG
jgi:hypothetical protein